MILGKRRVISILAGFTLFVGGIAVGSVVTRNVSAINRFGQPKTVIHVVAYKFKATTSQNDRRYGAPQ